MRGPYYIDSPTLDEARSRYLPDRLDYYTYVIRRLGRPGWVFRFSGPDTRLARQTLDSLNGRGS